MERWLQRYLSESDIVHHVNENKQDNRIENLFLTDENEHAKIHRLGRIPSQTQRKKARLKQQRNSSNIKRDQFGRFKKES